MPKKTKVDASGKKLKKKVKRDVAKVLNKNQLERKRLLGMNPYLQTLLDPFNVGGVKIPDMNSHPSGTFQILDRRTLTVNDQSVCAICYGAYGQTGASGQGGSLTPVRISGTGSAAYAIGMTNGTLSDANDLFTGGSAIYLTNWTAVGDPIPVTYAKVRLVSVGVSFQYLGAPLSAKGKASVCFAPRNQLRSTIPSGLGIDAIAKIPGSKVIPVNTLSGGMVLYQPQDGVSLEYVDTTSLSVATTGSIWDTDANLRAATGGEIYIALSGCTPEDEVQITAVFNYEGIPRSNALNLVSVSPSPNDPIALTHAFNTVQSAPTTAATTQPVVMGPGNVIPAQQNYVPHPIADSTAPVSSGMAITENKQQKESPTGMFDNLLSGVSGLVDKIPSMIDEFSPMLEGLAGLFL